MKDSSYLSKR